MEDIEDLLLKALALPNTSRSERQTKVRALRKAIVKCVIHFNESTLSKSKDLLDEYNLDINESIAVTSTDRLCRFVNSKTRRVTKYYMKGICLVLDDTGIEVQIYPLCKFASKDDDCVFEHEVSLNDFVQAAYALLCKVYETKAN
jgi:hypothetical protein